MEQVEVRGVFIGKAEDIGGGLSCAMNKQPVGHRLWLWPQGLGQDDLGDLRFHGGPERALHHYPAEHYAYWRSREPQLDWAQPSFGENLSTLGLSEEQVLIGDVFRWGGAVLQVSQPRSPCYRLNRDGQRPDLPQVVQDSGRCGWFYRVLQAGFVAAEDPLQLIRRGPSGLSVARALQCYYHTPLERCGLQQLLDCNELSQRWRDNAAQRLRSGHIEDWAARLLGSPLDGVVDALVRRYA